MTLKARRGSVLAAIGVACTVIVLALYAVPILAVLRLELLSQDLRAQFGRKTPVNTNLVFVGIDQPGYADLFGEDEIKENPLLGQMTTWPFSRAVYASIINRLVGAGAKVVALDFVFAGEKEGDTELAAALATHSNQVVIAANLTGDEGNALIAPDAALLGGVNARKDSRVAFINVWPDRDGIVRSARFKITRSDKEFLAPGEEIKSFAAAILRKAGADIRVPTDSALRVIRYSAPPRLGYPVVPLYTLFLKGHWENNYANGEFFRDKIVIVGPAANIMQDFHLVPLARVSTDKDTGEKVSDQYFQ